MPVRLRQRLVCHYCGKRSNSTKKYGDRFKCEHCLADNFLDENGEIADVPPEEVAAFEVSTHQPGAVGVTTSQSSVFCSDCTKNQYLYTSALSEYLPDPEDPNYEQIEAALPEFKKQLELRFPTCCAQCEPRVRSQLQQATYTAKADNLRRVLERTHARRVANRWGWRSLLVRGAGLGYAVSLATQLLWHALGSQTGLDSDGIDIDWKRCMSQYPVPLQCTRRAGEYVGVALMLGLVCIWWNPRWQYRLQGQEGRLIGLDQYYRIQAGILILRYGAWIVTKDIPGIDRYQSALHTVAFTLIAMITLWSLSGVVQIDKTPLVNWHQDPAPLLHRDQFVPPAPLRHPSLPHAKHDVTQQFPVDRLAGPQRPTFEVWQPPTPPIEEDMMDWVPSQPEFRPQPKLPVQKPQPQPSPFYGNLPEAPRRGRLHPRAPVMLGQPKPIGVPPGFFGLFKKQKVPGEATTDTTPSRPLMAEPKFFANTRSADTGLENIFDKIFSVQDAEEEAKKKAEPQISVPAPNQDMFALEPRPAPLIPQLSAEGAAVSQSLNIQTARPAVTLIRRTVSITIVILLISTAMAYSAVGYFFPWVSASASTGFRYAAIIPLSRFSLDFWHFKALNPMRVTFLVVQALALGCLTYFEPGEDSEHRILWNELVIGSICMLSVQEVYSYVSDQSTSNVEMTPRIALVSGIDSIEEPDHQEDNIFATSHPSPSYTSQAATYDVQNTPTNSRPTVYTRRDSSESLSSVSSINTTSTAAGWKTPKAAARQFDWLDSSHSNQSGPTGHRRQSSTPSTYGLGGLNLGQGFSSGVGVAGPRTRQARGTGQNQMTRGGGGGGADSGGMRQYR